MRKTREERKRNSYLGEKGVYLMESRTFESVESSFTEFNHFIKSNALKIVINPLTCTVVLVARAFFNVVNPSRCLYQDAIAGIKELSGSVQIVSRDRPKKPRFPFQVIQLFNEHPCTVKKRTGRY